MGAYTRQSRLGAQATRRWLHAQLSIQLGDSLLSSGPFADKTLLFANESEIFGDSPLTDFSPNVAIALSKAIIFPDFGPLLGTDQSTSCTTVRVPGSTSITRSPEKT